MSILSETFIMKINSYLPDEHVFLRRLTAIAKVPKRVYVQGGLPPTRVKAVAIVGTRKPSQYGTQVAFDLAEKLARRGVMIISGLAYGIDAAAHKGALAAGGITMAVMAHGLDRVYPAGHKSLAEMILRTGGCLISEYPEGTQALKHQFLERNRLVSGLADAVIVIEAAERSGTLRTVAEALEQGIDVCAIPGPITSPQSWGPNTLIHSGAHVIRSAEDILALLGIETDTVKHRIPPHASPEEHAILQALIDGLSSGEDLLEASGLSVPVFTQTLILLELQNHIRPLGGNRWAIRT